MEFNGTLEITTVVGCAVNCKYCPQDQLIKKYRTLSKENVMSMDTFITCVDKVPPQVSIHFSGFCEPWQNKHCTDMLLYAFQKGHPIQVFSTLQGMSIEDFNRIKHIPFEKFIIHLPDRQNNSRIRITDDYLEVTKNVLDHFNDPIRGKNFGASCHGEVSGDIETVIPSGLFESGNSLGIYQELHDRAGSLDFDELEHRYIGGKIMCGLCGKFLNRNVLLPNGLVVLCCMDYSLEFILGNLKSEKYNDLFTSSVFKQLQATLDDEGDNCLCRHCINSTQWIPVNKQVQDSPLENESDRISIRDISPATHRIFPYMLKLNLVAIYKQLKEYLIIKRSKLFDASYYLLNNPDVKKADKSALLHFIQNGWKEGRNPSPNFDTIYYIKTNPDVERSGMNPFFHYVLYGKKEGRASQPRPEGTLSRFYIGNALENAAEEGGMKFGLISMMRNAQDVLTTFLNHADALFDYALLIDHRSIDDTARILKEAVSQRNNWTYVTADINGYYQKEISKLVLPYLFESGADFVFFLDCDEFIQVENRKDLENRITRLIDSPAVGSLRWINCINNDINNKQFSYKSSLWKNNEPSQYSKVLIPKSLYGQQEGKILMVQGNHHSLDSAGNTLQEMEIGNIIHVPVRSKRQLAIKAIQSSLAAIARANRNSNDSFQFFKMLEMMAGGKINDDIVRGCIYLYQKESGIIPISESELTNGNYSKTSLKDLKIATTQKFSFKSEPWDDQVIERLIANQILSWENENPESLIYDQNSRRICVRE